LAIECDQFGGRALIENDRLDAADHQHEGRVVEVEGGTLRRLKRDDDRRRAPFPAAGHFELDAKIARAATHRLGSRRYRSEGDDTGKREA
jgi:hypothetical protein